MTARILTPAEAEAVAAWKSMTPEERDEVRSEIGLGLLEGYNALSAKAKRLESRAAELEAALQNLVEQVGKTVGLPPPSHQCPPDHAYSDFAQAINTALALLAKGFV